jgi:hypothetical protein
MAAILEGSLSVNFYQQPIAEIINEMIRQHLTSALTKEVELSSVSDQILSGRMRNDDIEMDFEETTFADSTDEDQHTQGSCVVLPCCLVQPRAVLEIAAL